MSSKIRGKKEGAFVAVDRRAFEDTIVNASASKLFRKHYPRMNSFAWHALDDDNPDFLIHQGPLEIAGDFVAPGFFTLITGDVTVDGMVDLSNPYDRGFEEGGLFVTRGSECDLFEPGLNAL